MKSTLTNMTYTLTNMTSTLTNMTSTLTNLPNSLQIVEGGAVAEARQALTNMGHILNAANCTFNNVVKTTVLMADMAVRPPSSWQT